MQGNYITVGEVAQILEMTPKALENALTFTRSIAPSTVKVPTDDGKRRAHLEIEGVIRWLKTVAPRRVPHAVELALRETSHPYTPQF